jgi:hypothetical protein
MTRYFGFPGTEIDAKRILAAPGNAEGLGGTPHSKPPTFDSLKIEGLVELLTREIAVRNSLLVALRNLTNECDALGFRETDIRALIGNTNWLILTQRVKESLTLLAEIESNKE